jgi:hypothetical protein
VEGRTLSVPQLVPHRTSLLLTPLDSMLLFCPDNSRFREAKCPLHTQLGRCGAERETQVVILRAYSFHYSTLPLAWGHKGVTMSHPFLLPADKGQGDSQGSGELRDREDTPLSVGPYPRVGWEGGNCRKRGTWRHERSKYRCFRAHHQCLHYTGLKFHSTHYPQGPLGI